MMGVSATPVMCFTGGKLVTVPAGGTRGGTGFDDSCVATGASGSIVCNQRTITCQGATSSKTSYTLTANAADVAGVTSCSIV